MLIIISFIIKLTFLIFLNKIMSEKNITSRDKNRNIKFYVIIKLNKS